MGWVLGRSLYAGMVRLVMDREWVLVPVNHVCTKIWSNPDQTKEAGSAYLVEIFSRHPPAQ